MSKWNETGILRKKQVKDNYDDLLVFGYACKLFRDDEKAQYIDQGKHLIPWMADDKLKIDRYDGRGALSDLNSCEASKEGYDATRWLGLSDSERKIEQLCDEERFYSLLTNEEEEAMYKEEEMKRKQANEFQYSYDVPRDPEQENSQDSVQTCEEDSTPFVPPTELDVPVDINIPKTLKENARVEKTALFVSVQGPQMEILIKAKQADNPQFNFMNQSDPLYKYYRHVLSAIKNGRYRPQKEERQEEVKESEEVPTDEHYLHPSLGQPTAPPPVAIRLPQMPYKPTADCAYSQLVTRIQGNNPHLEASGTPPPAPPPADDAAKISAQDQQQQYYQYYYSMQYYEYYKQIAQQYAVQAGCDVQTIVSNPQLQEQIQSQASHYAQASCAQYVQQAAANPYAQIVTNLAQNIKDSPPVPTDADVPVPVDKCEPKKTPTISSLAALAHYSSDSEDDDEIVTTLPDTKVTFKVPPAETVTIIDKMANYVSKNGNDFEDIVRAKGDSRFEFLQESHEYYKYYRHKLLEYRGETKPPAKKTKELAAEKTKEKEKKVITPVSFSIKKPKDENSKEIKSALPIEESDEDETHAVAQTPATPPVINIISQVIIQPQIIAETTPKLTQIIEEIEEKTITISEEATQQMEVRSPEINSPKKATNGDGFTDVDDPILEMIDLTDDLDEKKDVKREVKLKDKLAMVNERISTSRLKDRALQLERRKRAAMFLKMKSGSDDRETRTIGKVEEQHRGSRRETDERTGGGKKDEILKIDDSESEEGEIKREKKSSGRKKKSHKRKSSRSRSRRDSKSHRKKSKKRRRRSSSASSAV